MGNADGFFTLGSSLVTLRVLDLDPDLVVSASVGGLELLRPESGERRSAVGTFPRICIKSYLWYYSTI